MTDNYTDPIRFLWNIPNKLLETLFRYKVFQDYIIIRFIVKNHQKWIWFLDKIKSSNEKNRHSNYTLFGFSNNDLAYLIINAPITFPLRGWAYIDLMSESRSTKTTAVIIIISPSSQLKHFEKLSIKNSRHLEYQKVLWLKMFHWP